MGGSLLITSSCTRNSSQTPDAQLRGLGAARVSSEPPQRASAPSSCAESGSRREGGGARPGRPLSPPAVPSPAPEPQLSARQPPSITSAPAPLRLGGCRPRRGPSPSPLKQLEGEPGLGADLPHVLGGHCPPGRLRHRRRSGAKTPVDTGGVAPLQPTEPQRPSPRP